jgi:hypothetical protein
LGLLLTVRAELVEARFGERLFDIPIVTLNLVQGPWAIITVSRGAGGAPWMLKQVQHDGVGDGG